MATLGYSQIRVTPGGTIHYIANRDKMLSLDVHDVSRVLHYMGEPESTERVYAFAQYCSANPILAAKQMELYRARYYESKGWEPKEKELLGLHFFLSYSEEDDPDEAAMNDISAKLCKHPLLRDHAVIGANHYDKVHRHTHLYVSNFSSQGEPKKLCMRYEDFAELRKYANRLCVEHGLSIIDLPTLRYRDPAYSAWINGVIAEGRITVHPEREEHRITKHRGGSMKRIYYKQMMEKEESRIEEEKRLTPAQLRAKRARETYYWNFENDPAKPGYPAVDPDGKKRYHTIRLYDDNGRRRSTPELICLLLIAIYRYECAKRAPQQLVGRPIRAVQDHKLQRMVDAARVARELNVRGEEEVKMAIADTGRQMNVLRREKSRHENSIRRHEELLAAWDTYCNSSPEDDPEAFRRAYALLAQNRLLTEDAAEKLYHRYQFERQKILDYEKRLPELQRRYRNLKYLEQMICRPHWEAQRIYEEFAEKQSLEAQIRTAEARKAAQKDRPKEVQER